VTAGVLARNERERKAAAKRERENKAFGRAMAERMSLAAPPVPKKPLRISMNTALLIGGVFAAGVTANAGVPEVVIAFAAAVVAVGVWWHKRKARKAADAAIKAAAAANASN
jgi:hypothetical protein